MFICHRINTINQLLKIPKEYGIEIDLRDMDDKIIIQHDPFKSGELFEKYLKYYNHKIIILNIKSEGIEFKVLEILKRYNIQNYFFLDCSFPMIKKLIDINEKNIAVRFSEYEGLDTILKLRGLVNWIWVDCFSKVPLDKKIYIELKKKYNLCFVSPELQNQEEKIENYKKFFYKENIILDAICTKYHNIIKWSN